MAAFPLGAAILPDQLGAAAKKKDEKTVQPKDPALFEEYGFDASEQAQYGPMTVTAWRFKDSTGAMAAFDVLRPADARPSQLAKHAAQFPSGAIVEHGNYVLEFQGARPTDAQLGAILQGLPLYTESSLPVISTYLPAQDLIPNSQRYITGPVALQRFEPQIPPSTAAFHLSAEAQYGRYHTKQGDFGLAIFNYPTPSMARDQTSQFRKVPGAMVKRAGPLVAVVLNPPDPDAAERVLAKVTYEAAITRNENPPGHEVRSFAKAFLAMVKLSGIIIGFSLLSGLLFAGVRILSRRFGDKGADGAMITLHLEGK